MKWTTAAFASQLNAMQNLDRIATDVYWIANCDAIWAYGLMGYVKP
jgi:hypothetical protein